jgi:hypothetical protein
MPLPSLTINEARPGLSREPAPPVHGESRRGILPYVVLATVALFCQGLLLVNRSTTWDSWYVLEWLKTKSFAPMHDFFGSVGIPSFGLLYQAFAFFTDVPAAFMSATFACFFAGSVLTYHLILKLANVSRGEALAIAAIAQAVPVFNAAQDFIMFFFIFMHTLFLASALLVVRALETQGRQRWLCMGLGVVGFWFSFSNAALLVFYGAFYALLFIRFGKLPGTSLLRAGWRFACRHPLLLLLPPVNWAARGSLTPQYGWYEHYNSPIANIGNLGTNLWSFFKNVPWFHIRASFEWAGEHPLLIGLMLAASIAWWIAAPKRWNFTPGPLATRHLVWSGCLLLFLAIFPFAAAGKHFSASPVSSESHHFFLAGLPVAIFVYAAIRGAICGRHHAMFGWIATPLIACSVLVFGGQLIRYYLAEQAEWVFSQSMLHHAARDRTIRESSVIHLRGFAVARQPAFAMYGFALAFDELTRLVTPYRPEDEQRFYSPSEIERTLLRTAILPSEFKNINPAGQQTLVAAVRNRGDATDWDIVWRFHSIRLFGTVEGMTDYLRGLCTLKTLVIKSATPLEVAPATASADGDRLERAIPSGNFVNGARIEMISLPGNWWAGKFEVTQGQYERVMGTNPSLFKDPSRPVERVSWNDAVEFCRRLTEMEGKAGRLPRGFVYRLPSVQEFAQIAARGSMAVAVTSTQEIRWHTAPVGSLPANSLGLHDVVGNVWEWCLDWADDSHRFKVSSGGSWANYAWELAPYPGPLEGLGSYEMSVAERLYGPLRRDYPDQGFWDRGFRCVLAPDRAATIVTEAKR